MTYLDTLTEGDGKLLLYDTFIKKKKSLVGSEPRFTSKAALVLLDRNAAASWRWASVASPWRRVTSRDERN